MPFTSTNKFRFAGGNMSNIKWYLVRRWLYGVAVAVGAVLVYFKIMEPQAVVVLLPLILAAFNTNPPPVPGEPSE